MISTLTNNNHRVINQITNGMSSLNWPSILLNTPTSIEPKQKKTRPSTIKKRPDQFTPSDFRQIRFSPRLNSSFANAMKRRFDGIELDSPLCSSTPLSRKILRKF